MESVNLPPKPTIEASHVKQAKTFEKQAEQMESDGKLKQAVNFLKKAEGIYKESNDFEKLVKIQLKIGENYNQKGKIPQAKSYVEKAIQVINNNAPASLLLGEALNQLGKILHDSQNLKEGIKKWEQAIPFLKEAEKTFDLAITNRYIGFSYRDLGEDVTALTYFKKAFQYFKDHDNPLYAANTANVIGLTNQSLEKYDEAVLFFNKAIEYYNKSPNHFDHVNTLISLSIVHRELGNLEYSISTFVDALLLHEQDPTLTNDQLNLRETGYEYFTQKTLNSRLNEKIKEIKDEIDQSTKVDRFNTLRRLAIIYKAKGETERAIELYNEAISNKEDQQEELIGHVYQSLGKLFFEQNEMENALDYYRKAKDIFDRTDHREDEFYVIIGISKVLLKQGNPKAALDELKFGIELLKFKPGALIRAELLNAIGNIYRFKGKLSKSLEMHFQALDLIERTSNLIHETLTLHYLGETYYLMENYQLSLAKFDKAMKLFELTPHRIQKARTLTGLGNVYRVRGKKKEALKYYLEALELFSKDDQSGKDRIDKAYPLNNIAEIYIQMGEYDKAIQYTQQSLVLLNESPNPYLKAIPLKKLGKIFYEKGEKEKAFEFTAQAAEIFADSPNPEDIAKPLEVIKTYDPKHLNMVALSNSLGCVWLIDQFKKKIHDDLTIEPKEWKNAHQAISNIWFDVKEKREAGILENSQFMKNWKLKHMLEESSRNISSETLMNYLLGANDITYDSDDPKSLRDHQPELPPMWYVEIPDKVLHGQRYLKIRLNNYIYKDGQYTSIPDLYDEYPSIARIELRLETQWLQRLETDHIFYPNNDLEYESYESNEEDTWLSDIIVMDLGDHTKSVDEIDLNYSIRVYFEENSSTPDIRTTTKNIQIPVYRNKNFQRLEKFREEHNNSLAILLAAWSILISGTSWVMETGLDTIKAALKPLYILSGIGIIGFFGLIFTGWLLKSINNSKLKSRVQETIRDFDIEYYQTKSKTKTDEFENINLEQADQPNMK